MSCAREWAIANGLLVPATTPGDPTPAQWHDETPTLRLDQAGRLEAERERARPPSKAWKPPWDVLR